MPGSLVPCSTGMPKGKINPRGSAHKMWGTAELCGPKLDIKCTDLGCDPLLTDAVLAALTAPAESMAGHQRRSEKLLFHRTVC